MIKNSKPSSRNRRFEAKELSLLKYQSSTTLGCKDIGIKKSEFVANTQFLCQGVQTYKQTNKQANVLLYIY